MKEVLTTHYHTHGALFHAYLVTGSAHGAREAIRSFLAEVYGMSVEGNPDIWDVTYDPLGVDEARTIAARHVEKGMQREERFFLLDVRSATTEAQNTLLKTLEEPAGHVTFFLIAPDPDALLPTIRSRLTHIHCPEEGEEPHEVHRGDARAFLSASLPERLTQVKPLIDKKDRARARAFLDALEAEVEAHRDRSSAIRAFMHDVYVQKGHVRLRGSSLKLVLEHLALTAPRMTTSESIRSS